MTLPFIHTDAELPPLTCYGATDKFSSWRKLQERAIMAASESDRRFILQVAPTGSGKSAMYMGHSMLTGDRTIILTATKGLQAQLIDDFSSLGLVDIRGMNSYACRAAETEFSLRTNHTVSCDEGPCKSGLKCSIKESGCSYYDAYHRAQSASLVVTNYAYWMTINRYGEGLGKFDLMVCDEGHDCPEELSSFLSIELEPLEIETVLKSTPMRDGAGIDDWRKWAGHHAGQLEQEVDRLKLRMKERREQGKVDYATLREAGAMARVLGKLKSLAGMRGAWVVEQVTGERGGKRRWRFDPVTPAAYAEPVLFRGTPKVVIYSATIRKKTAELLGIPSADYDFNEWPSSFAIARRPVIHVPTCQFNHRTAASMTGQWVNRTDQIIRNRLDRKGVIHTTSFKRRTELLQNSEYAHLMIANDSHNTRAAIERFKKSDAPSILVSPSITTGYDFPYDEARYQVVLKIPFIDQRPLIVQARCEADKDYSNYVTMQTLIQICGRGMRAEDDWCETLVLDDNMRWFIPRYRQFAPAWFLEAVKWATTIPAPPALDRSGFGT